MMGLGLATKYLKNVYDLDMDGRKLWHYFRKFGVEPKRIDQFWMVTKEQADDFAVKFVDKRVHARGEDITINPDKPRQNPLVSSDEIERRFQQGERLMLEHRAMVFKVARDTGRRDYFDISTEIRVGILTVEVDDDDIARADIGCQLLVPDHDHCDYGRNAIESDYQSRGGIK